MANSNHTLKEDRLVLKTLKPSPNQETDKAPIKMFLK